MSESFSRREALKGLAVLVGAAGALKASKSQAVEAVHLSPTGAVLSTRPKTTYTIP